jgi:hypothetical protein
VGQQYRIRRLDEAAKYCTREGESPVIENCADSSCIPSSMGHEESHVNQRGPSRKAKYYCVTDSEPVPRGKGEKNPKWGVK